MKYNNDNRSGGYNRDNRNSRDNNNRSGGYNRDNNRDNRDNRNKTDNFNFRNNSGRPYNANKSDRPGGTFNKSDRPGNFNKFNRNDRTKRFDRFGGDRKPGGNFKGPRNNNSDNMQDRGFKKFNNFNNSNNFNRGSQSNKSFGDRNGGGDRNYNRNNRNNEDNGKFNKFNKFGKSDRPDRPVEFTKKDRFNEDKSSRNFDNKLNNSRNFKNRNDRNDRNDRDNINIKNTNTNIEIIERVVESVEQENTGMVYGRNAVIELLKSDKSIDKIFVQSGQREGSITMIVAEAIRKAVPVIEVEKQKLDSMINNTGHQGVIALASEKEYCAVADILNTAKERNQKPFILIAEKIMDPHNLGAIIRTAECAGVHGIIIPKRNAAGVSPIVSKTSAGASVHMAIAKVANIANTIEELKEEGVWIFAAAVPKNNEDNSDSDTEVTEDNKYNETNETREIKNYFDADYNLPLALVVGNEGEGLAPIILQKSDFLVKIPMFGKIDSLNVSCASAILLYEAARQRKQSEQS